MKYVIALVLSSLLLQPVTMVAAIDVSTEMPASVVSDDVLVPSEPVAAPAPVVAPPIVPTTKAIAAAASPPLFYGSVDVTSVAQIYLGAVHASGVLSYVDIFNDSDDPFSLAGSKLVFGYTSSQLCELPLVGYVLPGTYVTYATAPSADEYGIVGCVPIATSGQPYTVTLETAQGRVETVTIGKDGIGKHLYWKSKPKEDQLSLTTSYVADVPYHQGTPGALYEPRSSLPLKIIEVLPRPLLCAKNDERTQCRKYVKVKNESDEAVVLDGLRLRSGASGVSYVSGVVPANGFAVIDERVSHDPSDTELELNTTAGAVWFEDYHGLAVYPSGVVYEGAHLSAHEGQSWAHDDATGEWRWAIPSPYSEKNIFELGMGAIQAIEKPVTDTRVPCRENQYRSEETGRCRNIVVASATTPKPCQEGQYRSEETGRCRSVVSAVTDVLKPCGDGQFRNPLTGRCKKIVSPEDVAGLVPCAEGQERNPDTNRCRKIQLASMPKADFAVEPMKTAAKSFTSWWALGGVGLFAAGYGAWEWRRELSHNIKQVIRASGISRK